MVSVRRRERLLDVAGEARVLIDRATRWRSGSSHGRLVRPPASVVITSAVAGPTRCEPTVAVSER
jgi:hypothetical protein